ncbi:MAG: sulfite oxidase-like oxidoreductase [Pseudomonadota bacterium]|nr:MAG: oxidoreductase [Pseudomonadota bacterium]
MDRNKLEKIVEARLALKRRFEDAIRNTPSLADGSPLGSGPPNRHGMPRLPIGQTETRKWPVLDLGIHPEIAAENWTLDVDGACAQPLVLRFSDLLSLEQVEQEADFHCVTTWSRFDLRFGGVRVADVLALAEPLPEATHLMCHGYDGYTTNVSLAEALKPDVLLAHSVDGHPLPREHGGPVRMVTPQLYAWKGAKWIRRLELMTEDRPGFWEERGYSMTAYPWRNDRYG